MKAQGVSRETIARSYDEREEERKDEMDDGE